MKKLFIFALLMFTMTSGAQIKKVDDKPNVTMDANGNYKEIQDVNTGRLYYDKEGKSYPVFMSKNGKLYAITGISKKTGKPVRKYLKT